MYKVFFYLFDSTPERSVALIARDTTILLSINFQSQNFRIDTSSTDSVPRYDISSPSVVPEIFFCHSMFC